MLFFEIIITVPFLILGILLIKYARTIGSGTFTEIIPGKSTSSFLGRLFLKQKKDIDGDNIDEQRGIIIYTWFLRIFGMLIIIFCVFSIIVIIINP